jgi:DNA-binding CsgD family transcriptional regulator
VLKTARPEEIVAAVQAVYEGHLILDAQLTRRTELQGAAGELDFEALTERELEILTLAGRGLTNKAIGVQLYISDRTVQNHLAHIFQKLQAASRTEAVMRAVALGLLPPHLAQNNEERQGENERARQPGAAASGISWRGFTLRVFVVVILPLAALLMAIVIISQSLHHQAMTALVGERNLSAARSTAYVLETALKYQAESLQVAAEMVQAGTPLNSVDRSCGAGSKIFGGDVCVESRWRSTNDKRRSSLDLQGEQADFGKT